MKAHVDSRKAVAAVATDAPAPLSREQSPEVIAAIEVIRGGVRRWTDGLYTGGPKLPIVRGGTVQRHFGSEAYDPAERVLQGYHLPPNRSKLAERARLERLASSLQNSLRALANFDDRELHQLRRHMTIGRTTEERVARALGADKALAANINMILEATGRRIEKLSSEIDAEPRKRGSKKNVAAYSVAFELARLYAKVTGKRPIYSEGANGLSGHYTLALRAVYDALGWTKTVLRGPASEAVRKVTDADLDPEELRWPKPLVLGAPPPISRS